MSLVDFFNDSQSMYVFILGIVVSTIFLIGISYKLYGNNTFNKKWNLNIKMLNNDLFFNLIRIFISSSVFFVWIVRYENIKKEFEVFKIHESIRDIVGILKLSLAIMLLISIYDENYRIISAIGISIFMFFALLTHLKFKNYSYKIIPSLFLFLLSNLLIIYN